MTDIDQSVMDFVAKFTGVKRKRLTPESTLYGDLGIDGADGWELIEKFGQQFQVDLSGFRADGHFSPKGAPIYAPFMWLWFVLISPFRKRRSAEDEAGLRPIRISDLVLAAKEKRWTL